MDALQLRLEEESVVMTAAQGYTPEQRLLAYDTELTRKIKSLTEIQKDVRESLKEWYRENQMDTETGEVKESAPLVVGSVMYSPKVTTRRDYDTAKFLSKYGKKGYPFVKVEAGKITAAVKIGTFNYKELEAEGILTETKDIAHGTKAVDPI